MDFNFKQQSDSLEQDTTGKIMKALNEGYLKIVFEQMLNSSSFILFEEEESTHQITFLKNQNDKKISSINFGLCEEKLKNLYDIKDEELLMYKKENKVKEFNIPIIEYVLFTQNGTKQLNLSICDNEILEYNIPVSIDDNQIYKYDPKSDYYNDICNQYPIEGNIDMTLYEKKNQYNNNNLALCESNCLYKGYNSTI